MLVTTQTHKKINELTRGTSRVQNSRAYNRPGSGAVRAGGARVHSQVTVFIGSPQGHREAWREDSGDRCSREVASDSVKEGPSAQQSHLWETKEVIYIQAEWIRQSLTRQPAVCICPGKDRELGDWREAIEPGGLRRAFAARLPGSTSSLHHRQLCGPGQTS